MSSTHPIIRCYVKCAKLSSYLQKVKTLERTGFLTFLHPHLVITIPIPTELDHVPHPQQMQPPPLVVIVVTTLLTIILIIMHTRCPLLHHRIITINPYHHHPV